MIERYVFVKLRDPSRRDALAAEALRVLPTVPGVRGVRVGTPADADAEVWDVSLAVRFDRVEDVAPYLVHPDHERFVADHIAPHAAVKKAWNLAVRSSE